MNLYPDRISKFLDNCFESGIKNPVAWMESKMPQLYGYLRGAFPNKILPTDVDGEVYLNGRFLRLEFKNVEAIRNGHISKGQLIYLNALAREHNFTVFLVGVDDAQDPVYCQILRPVEPRIVDPLCGRAGLWNLCHKWSEAAEKKKHI